MAKNLRAKIPASDTLVVADRDTTATARFAREIGAGVEVVSSPRKVAEKSVSKFIPSNPICITT